MIVAEERTLPVASFLLSSQKSITRGSSHSRTPVQVAVFLPGSCIKKYITPKNMEKYFGG